MGRDRELLFIDGCPPARRRVFSKKKPLCGFVFTMIWTLGAFRLVMTADHGKVLHILKGGGIKRMRERERKVGRFLLFLYDSMGSCLFIGTVFVWVCVYICVCSASFSLSLFLENWGYLTSFFPYFYTRGFFPFGLLFSTFITQFVREWIGTSVNSRERERAWGRGVWSYPRYLIAWNSLPPPSVTCLILFSCLCNSMN